MVPPFHFSLFKNGRFYNTGADPVQETVITKAKCLVKVNIWLWPAESTNRQTGVCQLFPLILWSVGCLFASASSMRCSYDL